ncbi:MAG: arsenate reductase ArsC [Deltaproteobacteria bacterium]|nr:arsenate reductase ArsC [Deltaproteobacteria bacterium]
MKILFVCTGNSCRSQMAEGLARAAGVTAYSAGTEPAGYVHPLAVQVMGEIGINISGQKSKPLELNMAKDMDAVITVCGEAEEACPVVPHTNRLHWPISDPAKAVGTPEEVVGVFRAVRDDIARRVNELLKEKKG